MLDSLIMSREPGRERLLVRVSNLALGLMEMEISGQSGWAGCVASLCRLLHGPEPDLKEERTETGQKMG